MTKVGEFEISVAQRDGYAFEVRFDKPQHPLLATDEPPPLGKDAAPNPSRLLAAAIGSCLSASFLFCMQRHLRSELPGGLRAEVHVDIVRNEQKRQRIGKVNVTLHPKQGSDEAKLAECRELFEDFCTVTQSVRSGIDVDVQVVPER